MTVKVKRVVTRAMRNALRRWTRWNMSPNANSAKHNPHNDIMLTLWGKKK